MDDELHRVTFRFGRDAEVHYVHDLPSIGDHVTHGRELWIVARVDSDPLDALVVCERPRHRPSRTRGLVESFV
jgi:hypothetical protein